MLRFDQGSVPKRV